MLLMKKNDDQGFSPKFIADAIYRAANNQSPASTQPAAYKGGAIFLAPNSSFTMRGGTISNHKNTYGGAIFVSDGATFTMDGGTIKQCEAIYGGAIYVASGGNCYINGGTITLNSAQYAPAIYCEAGAHLTISNNATIDKNTIVYNGIIISTDTIQVGNLDSTLYLPYAYFGSYPQSYVGDALNTELEQWYQQSTPPVAKTYSLRTRTFTSHYYKDGNLYARGLSYATKSNWSAVDGSGLVTYKNGDLVKTDESPAWFKVEPIRWFILNFEAYQTTTNYLELFSEEALATNIYFNELNDQGNDWATSYIRSWLSDTFYNSVFSSEEQKFIATTTLNNDKKLSDPSTDQTTLEGISTEDKIYIYKSTEISNSPKFTDPNSIYSSPTDFCLSNDCVLYYGDYEAASGLPCGNKLKFSNNSSGSTGWVSRYTFTLRLPNRSTYRWYSFTGSGADNFVSYTTTATIFGIRPALRILL